MLSETDKRKQNLRVQLYGKGESPKINLHSQKRPYTPQTVVITSHLTQDITKIVILAGFATFAQITLYIILKLGYINF